MRLPENESAITVSIVLTLKTGSDGSIACAAPRAEAIRDIGSDAPRTTRLIPPLGYCVKGWWISGLVGCVKPDCLTSPTTPTIVTQSSFNQRMRLPIGF